MKMGYDTAHPLLEIEVFVFFDNIVGITDIRQKNVGAKFWNKFYIAIKVQNRGILKDR